MKTMLTAFAIGSMMVASAAMAHPRRAACVGGPRVPSYAFDSYDDANRCGQVIASQGRACAQYVKVGDCDTESVYVDTVYPENCRCDSQGQGAIGSWSR